MLFLFYSNKFRMNCEKKKMPLKKACFKSLAINYLWKSIGKKITKK